MISIARRQTLADLVRRSARRFPSKLAIACGSTRWTFAEPDLIVERLAGALADRGIAVGDRVAVLSRNSHRLAAPTLCAGPDRRGAGADQFHAEDGRGR